MNFNKLAFVFPGQGSQAVGMLQELAGKYQVIQDTFAEASKELGYDLWDLVQNDPEGKLNKTEYTQPAVLTAGVALWRLWNQRSEIKPDVVAGHSLGEYTALVAAEVLSFKEAVTLVAERGHLMQEAVAEGEGGMAAILGIGAEQLNAICVQAAIVVETDKQEVVQAVNFNAPGQIVIAGDKTAVERAIVLAKEAGAKRALMLPLSVPSHCSLMQPAADKLAVKLKQVTWGKAKYPVIHNYDVQVHSDSKEYIEVLAKQLYNPVRWVETMEQIKQLGVDLVIECGPGKVLTGLTKRIAKELSCIPISDPKELDLAVQ